MNYSAEKLFKKSNLIIFFVFIIFFTSYLYYVNFPIIHSLIIIFNVIYLFTNIYRLRLYLSGWKIYQKTEFKDSIISSEDPEFPSYTLLVPLFKEASMVARLCKALNTIYYPRNKLQILLIVEELDRQTIDAIKELNLPEYFQCIEVPYSYPQTKAKACNYALENAKGEYIAIYDAEDNPDPYQLIHVVNEFKNLPDDYACVQCRLRIYNRHTNWLTAMFAIEYTCLFDFTLPAVNMRGYPIPLGGTSNHFKLSILKKLKGWDPFNVTEDAALGLKIASSGYRTQIISSYTYEEALPVIKYWIRQRARWIKGYIITFIVYARYPKHYLNKVGFKGYLFSIYILLFAPLMQACTPFGIGISIWFANEHSSTQNLYLNLLHILCWFNLLFGIGSFCYIAYSAKKAVKGYLGWWWWSYPFYFILHTFAAFRAIWQLFYSPHHWEKSPHGFHIQ